MNIYSTVETYENGEHKLLDDKGFAIVRSPATKLLTRIVRTKCHGLVHRGIQDPPCDLCPDNVGWNYPPTPTYYADYVGGWGQQIFDSWQEQIGGTFEEFVDAMWQGYCQELWKVLGLYEAS